MRSIILAILVVCAACDDDPPPTGNPTATVSTAPTLVPDQNMDYRYYTRYAWSNRNNRQYHTVVEHRCKIVYVPTGAGKPRYASMTLREFWKLEANGEMAPRTVDHIERAAGRRGMLDACEECTYKVTGVKVKKSARPRSSAIFWEELDAYRENDGNWYRQNSAEPRYYEDFRYSPPGNVDYTEMTGREITWTSRYRFKSTQPPPEKDALTLTGITQGGQWGPTTIPPCDIAFPNPSDIRPAR